MTKRETAKAERRDRIVKAAIALAEEAGVDGFSMRDLAKRAQVSHATPFNLFGSKGEIISRIFEIDLENFREAMVARRPVDEIEAFFDMICMATRFFRQKQSLYRALYTSFRETASDSVLQRFHQPRVKFFEELVRAAQTAGYLEPALSPPLMARACQHVWEAVLLDWANRHISLKRMEYEVCFGYATLLAGFAVPTVRDRLLERMITYQQRITASPSRQKATA